MKESYSGLFRKDVTIPHSGMSRVPSGGHKDFGKSVPNIAPKEEPKPAEPQANKFHKKKLPLSPAEGPAKVPSMIKKEKWEPLLVRKENKTAHSVAKELSEAWWCGTPALEAKKRKLDTGTANQPDKIGNWSVNAVDKPVTEAEKPKAKAKPKADPKYKAPKAPKTRTDKPNRVPTAKNEDPAMAHAKKIMKMANTVSGSLYAGPLDILAAAYAKHTFHPDNIGEAEQIVNKFLEDTTTGDVASIALGFAPTGEMDPREGRPGKKKKKKKNQFDELSKEMSAGSSYHKLSRKVAGSMSGV